MSYPLRLTVSNPGSTPRSVLIHGGTVFEVEDPLSGVQNLVATTRTQVTVPAGGSQVIEIDTWCLNHAFAPPSGTPMRPTALATVRDYASQAELWADMDARR